MRVLLTSMPFGALERQALGLSLLKACLARSGVECDVRYLNLDFAGLLGVNDYLWISRELPHTAFAGDFCFVEQLYGVDNRRETDYVEQVLLGTWGLSREAVKRVARVKALTGVFLEHCLGSVDWSSYDLVGFTSTFEQNIASLALAKRLKERYPRLRIVFGGANWEGEMGLELHRAFPFVDYVCSGEAELSLPALVERVAQRRSPHDVPGIVYRRAGRSYATERGNGLTDLDQLPTPDHADYFRDLAASSCSTDVLPVLLFETSRGCWWGAKSHCTFCGLNGGAIAFRAKSQGRALSELTALTQQWRAGMVECVDNILDMRYFREFLPGVVAQRLDLQLFFEVKANLTRLQVKLLADAGARRIQPGIESMSDHVLNLMRKGTSALQNVQLLKWCREYGVVAEWNLLYGFPGETAEDYQQMLELLPSLRHLGAPTACGPLRLDRFSPYFERPAEFGLRNLRAIESYKHLYPLDAQALSRISYYFEFDYEPARDPALYAAPVIAHVQHWQTSPERGGLNARRLPDGQLRLEDTRSNATTPAVTLGGLEQVAYEYCDQVRSFAAIRTQVQRRFPEVSFREEALRQFLNSAVANRLMARQGDRYLGLAIATGSLRLALEEAARQVRGRQLTLESAAP